MANNLSTYDILIIGGGIVGATTALALAQKTSLRIALLDAREVSSQWRQEQCDHRVSAVSLASQRIFRHLGAWESMQAKRVSPYQKMHVWEAGTVGAVDFDCRAIHAPALGHIIEDSVMRSSIIAGFAAFPQLEVIAPRQLASLREMPDHVEVVTVAGDCLRAKLLIGADGGHSWVRQQANIDMTQRDYAHRAIVATVATALPHQRTARQRFLPTGPLAFLPLTDAQQCSIVWSTLPEEATRLMALERETFQQELTQAFAHKLGAVTLLSPCYSFDLHMRHVKNYVKPRLALIGDAAHTIHPLAGQGVNLGLLDAACLVDGIVTALAKKRDFASLTVLRRYERWRKADNVMMLGFVAAIKALFASESQFIASLRHMGMNMTNKMDFMKAFFANYAAGNRETLPALAAEWLME